MADASGFLRIRTPLRYSDGGLVELYVEARSSRLIITDFGESFRFLRTYGLDPLRSAVRRNIVDLALELGGATVDQDALEIAVENAEDLVGALLRLGQVVTRVSDLALSARGALTATFPDTVEEFIRSGAPDVEVKRNEFIDGNATVHSFDLVTRSPRGTRILAALSAISASGAGAQTAFTIRKFADIAALGASAPKRITIVDDSADVWSDSLRRELSNYSDVIDWERRDELLSQL